MIMSRTASHDPTSTAAAAQLLPDLLLRRCEGKLNATQFSHTLLRKRRSRWSLLTNHQILCSTSSSSSRRTVTTTSSLDLSSKDGRFLLAGRDDGSLELYDLSRWGGDDVIESSAQGPGATRCWRYAPVARALRAPLASSSSPGSSNHVPPRQGHKGEITSAKWYPADSGAFLTASVDGNLLVWDANEMVPVINYTPFHRYQHNSTTTSTRPASSSSRLGNLSSPITSAAAEVLTIDCMDVSKLSVHSVAVASRWDASLKLVDIRTGAASHSLTEHDRGILCLQWSPSSEHVVASGGVDRTVRLWDVRKAGPRACLTVLNQHFVPDVTLSKASLPHYGHLRGSQRHASLSSSDRPVLNLAFDPTGQYLVTHDGTLAVRDLRDGQGAFQLPRRFVGPHGNVYFASVQPPTWNSEYSLPLQPVLGTVDDGPDGWSIWTSIGSSLAGFSVGRGGGSTPQQLLKGHISHVRALAVAPASSGEAAASLVSSGRDGLILLWGHSKYEYRNDKGGRDRSHRGNSGYEDRDNW